jgi:type VI secretion system protein ImpJ
MSAHKLARIKWYVGQTLQPDHFFLSEEAMLAEARLSARVRGLPGYGVARLAWNTQLLVQGDLVISALTVVFPDDQLVDVPGNALVAPLDLRAETGQRISVYLHLLGQTQDAKGNRLYEDDPRGVDRVMRTLRLATEPSMTGAAATLKLLELERDSSGAWQVRPSYAPPLVQVGTSPFFAPLVEDLLARLANLRREVLMHLSDAYVARDQAAAVRRMVVQIQELVCVLEDLEHGIYPHPYQLFAALRTLYFGACCFFEAEPETALPRYTHDEPAACLGRMAELLKARLGHVRPRMRYCAFVLQGGSFLVSPLPKELADASEMFFLVQRPDMQRRVPIETIKLASPKRLPAVHRLALRGVDFRPITQLPFPNSFGPEIDFYEIQPSEEWSHVLNEAAIGFYARPEHEAVTFSLFWRA